jgi:REP element-mobilizing transposase RayT
MIVGYHLIWTAYWWWLPNDPRGSMSQSISSDVLTQLGELHYGRKTVQPAGWEIREFYQRAKQLLKHELLTFDPEDISTIADSFADTFRRRRYNCYACAVILDHVHLLIRRHREMPETMIAAFQETSRSAMIAQGKRPADHPVWGGPGWAVYLDSQQDIERTIGYIEQNPVKMGRLLQKWSFVTPYDGWLPGLWTPYKK